MCDTTITTDRYHTDQYHGVKHGYEKTKRTEFRIVPSLIQTPQILESTPLFSKLDLLSVRSAHSERKSGIEPATLRMQGRRSTRWATRTSMRVRSLVTQAVRPRVWVSTPVLPVYVALKYASLNRMRFRPGYMSFESKQMAPAPARVVVLNE